MASYYRESGLTHDQYLQAQAFVDDIRLQVSQSNAELAGLSREMLQTIGAEAGATRETLIAQERATRAAIAAEGEETRATMVEGFNALGELTSRGFASLEERTQEGFETIHLDLRANTQAVWMVSSILEQGFAAIEGRLGSLATSIGDLIAIAKTPEQTWAYEQYQVALEACRRGLFEDALESVSHALRGYGPHTGYKLEHRFHRLMGLIHCAAPEAPTRDLSKAEEAYLTGARYAESVDKPEAASCLLRASQLAYGRGDATVAEQRSLRALKLHESGEGHFLVAKYMLANGKPVNAALDFLEKAFVAAPVFFLLAVARDESGNVSEFLKQEMEVRSCAERASAKLRASAAASIEKSRQALRKASAVLVLTGTQIKELVDQKTSTSLYMQPAAEIAYQAQCLVDEVASLSQDGIFGAKAAHDRLDGVAWKLASATDQIRQTIYVSEYLADLARHSIEARVKHWHGVLPSSSSNGDGQFLELTLSQLQQAGLRKIREIDAKKQAIRQSAAGFEQWVAHAFASLPKVQTRDATASAFDRALYGSKSEVLPKPKISEHLIVFVDQVAGAGKVVREKGTYRGRRWVSYADGCVEGEMMVGGFRRFSSFNAFKDYID